MRTAPDELEVRLLLGLAGGAEVVDLHSGICIKIPVGTRFQFRSLGAEPLAAIGVTMPPWPGDGEVVMVAGAWATTVS